METAKQPLDLKPTAAERKRSQEILEKQGLAAANLYYREISREKRLAWDLAHPKPNQQHVLLEILEAGLKALGF
jgi:hypothetical protein